MGKSPFPVTQNILAEQYDEYAIRPSRIFMVYTEVSTIISKAE
jgi:hypothetical protein